MNNDIKTQIRDYSSQAAQLSKEALTEFAAQNFVQGKALMKKANEAGNNCRQLIEQLTQTTEISKNN